MMRYKNARVYFTSSKLKKTEQEEQSKVSQYN